jgi:hypothetical protein
VILKLDFEKSFDKVGHEVILEVLRHKGFPKKWVTWVHDILSSGTSYVLLNGVPRKVFNVRGVLGREILCSHCYLYSQLIFYSH